MKGARDQDNDRLIEQIGRFTQASQGSLSLPALIALLEHNDRERQNEALENIAECLQGMVPS